MRARLLTVTLAAVLAAPAAAAVSSASTATTPNGGTPAGAALRTVDLALTLPAPRAVPRGATGSLRTAALAALTPSAASRAAVVAAAAALGLRPVASGGTGTLAVQGPSALVGNLFPALGRTDGSLAVPPGLAGYVTAALDPAATTPLWRGFDTGTHQVTGPQLDSAYGVTPAPVATVPALTATTGIVATLQLSGWSNSDLTAYAPYVYGSGTGYDPVASGQYVAVSVDGRGEALTTADGNGDGEVALDQETLLATAPQLKQRAYFAPNSSAGVTDAVARVLADVQAGLPVLAFSSSYGGCESDVDSRTAVALNAGLASLTAAGVTVFAASGDQGQYCTSSSTGGVLGSAASTTTQATFPASAPAAIAVGGTRHENGAGAPLPDTAWDKGGTGVNAEGSGGGTSVLFGRPGYQSGLAPAGGGSGRLLPDLALDGDPATGIVTITRGAMALTGGTSLSSPLAAAQLSDLIAARAPAGFAPVGLGDVHAALYAHPAAFADVVRIQDGTTTAADQPTTAGFDLSTGLGTPTWSSLAAALFTAAAPALQLPATSTTTALPVTVNPAGGVSAVQVFASVDGDSGCTGSPLGLGTSTLVVPQGVHTIVVHTLGRSGQCSLPASAQTTVDSVAPTAQVTSFGRIGVTSQVLSLQWGGVDPAPGTGIASWLVTVTHKGGATPDLSARVLGSTLSMTKLVSGGADEVLAVTPTDAFGNVGATARSGAVDVPVDDRSARVSKGWVRGKAPSTYSGTVTTTSKAGATAAITLRGSIVGILATTSAKGGRVQLIVDGKVRRTISLRSKGTKVRQGFTYRTSDASHSIVVRSLGGGTVVLDGLIVD